MDVLRSDGKRICIEWNSFDMDMSGKARTRMAAEEQGLAWQRMSKERRGQSNGKQRKARRCNGSAMRCDGIGVIEMEGRLTGFSLNRDGTQNVTVTVSADFGDMYDELKDAPVEIQIKKAQKHRSMETNRYAWVLIDQIAARQHLKKSEVYRNAIREIGGVSKTMLMKDDAVPVFRQIWEKEGLGNQVEVEGTDEMGWVQLRVYFGSSTYDTEQMSALLDSLIQDAEALGIPTITPKEEERMLGKWARKKDGNGEQVDHAKG